MIIWPTSLPQSPLIEGFSDIPQDTVIRSKFDGYSKIRNRYTAAMHIVTENYLLTKSQFDTFRNFYETTLGNGSEDFNKPDPVEGGTSVYRFTQPYDYEFLGIHFRVSLDMEKLP